MLLITLSRVVSYLKITYYKNKLKFFYKMKNKTLIKYLLGKPDIKFINFCF